MGRPGLNCIKSRRRLGASVFYHTRVDALIVLSLCSLNLGRSIRFDSATEEIAGDAEAAKRVVLWYRGPRKFPKQYLS